MAKREADQGMSIVAVSLTAGFLMTYLLWGIACAMYDAAGHGEVAAFEPGDDLNEAGIRFRGRGTAMAFGAAGVATFVSKSFAMLPEMPSVVAFVFRERFWFAIVSALILGGVALFAWFLKRTEAALARPARGRKRAR